MKKINYLFLPSLIFLTIFLLSIGYSAFGTEMLIGNIAAEVRVDSNIRVSGIYIDSSTNDGISNYEDYNVESISSNVTLPYANSTITYKVSVTNYGNVDMGIFELSGLNENLIYETKEYELKSKICDNNNNCTLGAKKEFLIIIKYKENCYDALNTNFNIDLIFDFRPIHTITYSGIVNNGYPTEIIDGGDLKVTFTGVIPRKVIPYYGESELEKYDYDMYTYENSTIMMSNITEDIILKYVDKVYLATLLEGLYFKESAYVTKIKTVEFVDYIKVPENAIKSYDLSSESDHSIIGWIDNNYNLFIGSDWDIYSKDLNSAFSGMTNVISIEFNNLNTSEATSMYRLFKNCQKLLSLDLSSFNTSNVTNMRTMFYYCYALKSVNLSNFNVSKVTSMQTMFFGCGNLTDLDLSSFTTSKVTNVQQMFSGCASLATLNLSNFKTGKLTTMLEMFRNCENITVLDLSGFNTSLITDMSYLFYDMASLTSLNLSNFDTSKVTNMELMFYNCNSLISLDLSNFNTSLVTNMKQMFSKMTSLKKLDLSNFNTSQVTNMGSMFYDVPSLTSLNISSFDTSKVTKMDHMFYNCKLLTELNLSNFNTAQVTDMRNMFNSCTSLTNLDLSNFNTSQVTDMGSMFRHTSSLTNLNLSSFNTTKVTDMSYMFYYTTSLKTLDLSSFDVASVTNMYKMFHNSAVTYLDFRNASFGNVSNYADMFMYARVNIYVIVKDDIEKAWLQTRLDEFSGGTVVKVSEL